MGAAYIGGKAVFMEKLQSSPEELHFALESTKCTIMSAPPIVYEQMIDNLKKTKDFSTVKRLLAAVFGGAPLKYESGYRLQQHGVNVRDMYGSTETGGSMSSNLDPRSENWASVAPFLKDANGRYYHVFETDDASEPDIKHLYIRKGSPSLATGVSNRADGGFDTNDLFREDTRFPGYYRYVDRRDDMLIMANGKKTDPVSMEASIRQSAIVKQVAVIGHGRQCTADLIEIDMDYAKRVSPDEIVSTVHVDIKRSNKECNSKHSIILPQMVKILPLQRMLPCTDKGTVMRKKAEVEYIGIVERLYEDLVQGPGHRDFDNDTSSWTYAQVEAFVVACAVKVLDKGSTEIDRKQSFFYYGLNSLTAIQFRNLVAEYFDNVPLNFLYQYTSVEAVCKALVGTTAVEEEEHGERRYQQKTQQMAIDYIERAKRDFPVAAVSENSYSNKQEKVILPTGATGSLGSFILRDLLLDRSVKKVYVMVREKPGLPIMARLMQAFGARSLDTSLLKGDRVKVLSMQLDQPFLGLSDENYFGIKKEVTIVQHCGWLLDFYMTVEHYDKECIAPFYNLLRFAYRQVNPIHVHFVSSVSASVVGGGESASEEPVRLDSTVAMSMGYAQSKFVVEVLLNYLTAEKNVPCYVESVTQVCGDWEKGVWNTSEMCPLMFVGGSRMCKLPDLGIMVDWITMDHAAKAISEIMLKTAYLPASKQQSVYHIFNPRLVKWRDVLESVKEADMRFEVVTPVEWLDALAKDESNPTFKLLAFYQELFLKSLKMPVWETKKTVVFTSVIEMAPVVDSRLLGKFFEQWKSVGFYKPDI